MSLSDDFIRLLFLRTLIVRHLPVYALPEESDQFRFLRAAGLANLKGSVGWILVEGSVIRISWPFIPLPRFIRSRHYTPLLALPSYMLQFYFALCRRFLAQ
jgi:hypothetical protein